MKYVICAIIKNEHPYIVEWVDYHLNIGFEKIYLFEDFGSDSHALLLSTYINKGQVEIIPLERNILGITKGNCVMGYQTQVQVYRYFFDLCKKSNIADWVAFIDVDEFIVFDKEWNLYKLIEEFKDYGGILLEWILYGANGYINKPNCKVIEAYTKHAPLYMSVDSVRWNHKCIANIKKTKEVSVHDCEGYVKTDGTNENFSIRVFEKAHINHYYTRSFEEYCDRMFKRGNMANYTRSFDLFFELSPELKSKEKELLESIRNDSYNCDVMYISHKHGLIAGGNAKRIDELNKKYIINTH